MAAPAVLTVADTIARSFLLSVDTRGDRPAIREKKFGVWQPTTWREWLRSPGHRLRAARDRLSSRRRRLHHVERRAGMGLCRHGHPLRGRRVVRHLSDRFGGAGRISRQRFPHQGDVRRGRRATRQGSELPRALSDLERIVIFDMEGLTGFSDPMVMSLAEFTALGRNHIQGREELWAEMLAAAAPTISRSWSTPRARPGRPRAPCMPTAAWCTRCAMPTT